MSNVIHTPITADSDGLAEILDARGEKIAECWSATDLNRIEGQQVAEEIVRRVNAHDELIARLRDCLAALNQIPNTTIPSINAMSTYRLASQIQNLLASTNTKEIAA